MKTGASKQIYRAGDLEIDPLQGCLMGSDGVRHLRPKTLQVLLYLIEQRQRLVTKEELIERLWSGTAVTDDAVVQCIVDIRKALGDDPHRPRYIKTFPKAGYRFIGPIEELQLDLPAVQTSTQVAEVEIEEVTTVEVEVEEAAPAQELLPEKTIGLREMLKPAQRPSRQWVGVIAAALIVTAIAGGYVGRKLWTVQPMAADVRLPQVPGKRAVAVMYFENQSGSQEMDWLREGLADMLITNLSRSSKLTVLSRQHLALLLERIGHQAKDNLRLDEALEIARRSQAEVMVLGSFAVIGEQVRLNLQLQDVGTGQILTAESLTLDRAAQILTQVDLLSLKLAAHLGAAPAGHAPKPGLADAMTNNLEAYRYYSLALEKAPALNNTEAIALLEKAIALDPEFAMAYARIGYAYAVTWDLAEKAKPYLEKAFQLSHRLTEKDKRYITAWYAIANLDFTGAMRPLREIIALDPRDIEAYWRLGCLLEGEDQFQAAIDVLKQALVVDPEAAEIYNVLGFLNADLGKHDEAIAMIQRQIALTPKEPNAHNSLGLIYHWAGRYPEAIAAYEQSLALNPDFDLATVHLGNVYFHQGHYQAAIEQYERYIQLAKSQVERARGYGRIAWVYWKKGDRARAAEAARMEMKYEPTAVFNSVVLALDGGEIARAEGLIEQTAKFNYTSRGARTSQRYLLFFRGQIALKSGRTAEAIKHFKQTLQHRPPIWATDAYEDCLANAYLEMGRWDEAIAEYERILRLNPNYPLAQYHLGQAYERKGEQARARAAYERFLQIWPGADADIPEVIEAKRRASA